MKIEKIADKGYILGIIIRKSFKKDGIEFISPEDFPLQLGYMSRPKGYEIEAHVHNRFVRRTDSTQEVLFVKSGRVRIDFFSAEKSYLKSRVLTAGDIVLLSGGGHGVKVLENAELLEVKNGPYAGGADKTRFKPSKRKR